MTACSGYSPLVRSRSATPLLLATNFTAGSSAGGASSKNLHIMPSFFAASSSWSAAAAATARQRVCNPTRNAVSTRFTLNDWSNFNKMKQRQSSRELESTEQLRVAAWTSVQLTDHKTRVQQSEASRKLGERVQDIEILQKQLEREAQLNSAETQRLTEQVRVLEAALSHTTRPLHISEECLLSREERAGIDRVSDNVERQLLREVECIQRCQGQMQRMAEKALTQLQLCRDSLHQLDKDLRNKRHARGIDEKMRRLQNHSPDVAHHPGIESVDNSLSIPDSWARHSQENMTRSQRCRAASEKLRSAIESLLRGCANQMWSQYSAVNASFSARIGEITEARNCLQAQLQRTVFEISEIERAMSHLRSAIADKEAPMKVAQTRLEARTRRLEVEICSDPPMNALQREVLDITESLRVLRDRLHSLEAALSRLSKTRTILEADIRLKEGSILIDSRRCMGMRTGQHL